MTCLNRKAVLLFSSLLFIAVFFTAARPSASFSPAKNSKANSDYICQAKQTIPTIQSIEPETNLLNNLFNDFGTSFIYEKIPASCFSFLLTAKYKLILENKQPFNSNKFLSNIVSTTTLF